MAEERHGHGMLCVNPPLNAELNPICHLLALLGTHHILHVSKVRVNVYKFVAAPVRRGKCLRNRIFGTDCTNWVLPSIIHCLESIYLIFIGPCIVIHSHSTTNKMHLLSQIIYSCKTLYMFRTVFPSIIRSSKLRIQQRYMSNSRWYLLLQQQVPAAVRRIPLLYAQFWAPDDGRKDRPKHVERFTGINNLR
jgi:hypothetical protein